jgi:NAD+ synthase (glutamine-hydrolysing)
MKLIKVGAAILNQTPLDWLNNKANILGAIRAAKAEGVSILCLPELCICGYGCEDAFHSTGVQETSLEVLTEVLPETRGIITALGLPLSHRNGLVDAVCVVADGQVLGFVGKRVLAHEGIHYEPRWFRAWPEKVRDEVVLDGKTYAIGDIYFDIGGMKIGFEICQDAWAARRPGGDLAGEGIDVILNPSASHFAFGKFEARKRLVLEGSRAFGVSYLYGNLVGNEAGRAIYDGGAMIASAGKMLAIGPRLTFAPFHVTCAVIDVDATRTYQSRMSTDTSRHADNRCLTGSLEFPRLEPVHQETRQPNWESSRFLKEEEFTRAIALGLFDYLRKSHCRGFVVSVSGGADSSAVACLAAMMVHLGCKELGVEQFKARANVADLPAQSPDDIVHAILTCAYQSTENSSDVTRTAARQVAEAINADYLELDVDALVKSYVALIEKAVGRKLSWATDDVVLQNIQARTRAPGVWMLANLRNALLLATSNRSEAAVGYTTMDGDTCGSLSPIAGIDKAFLMRWLKWLQDDGPDGLKPIAALEAVNRQSPTAELRPPQARQTDEDDLMPYDLLDAIECAAIRDKKTPVEVFQLMQAEFPRYDRKQLAVWVERFFVLWSGNQWKRERYAPSFHVDDKNLDPKTWCRFPILSGGFCRELRELRKLLE